MWLILLSILAHAEEMQAPPTFATLNSICNDRADEAFVALSLQMAAQASDAEIGRAIPPMLDRVANFLGAVANCRAKEDQIELAQVAPGGDVAGAQAALPPALNALRASVEAALVAPSADVDFKFNGEMGPRFLLLLNNIRGGQQYLRSSEMMRISFRRLLVDVAQDSIACRTLVKQGKDANACFQALREKMGAGENAIASFAGSVITAFEVLSERVSSATSKKAQLLSQSLSQRGLALQFTQQAGLVDQEASRQIEVARNVKTQGAQLVANANSWKSYINSLFQSVQQLRASANSLSEVSVQTKSYAGYLLWVSSQLRGWISAMFAQLFGLQSQAMSAQFWENYYLNSGYYYYYMAQLCANWGAWSYYSYYMGIAYYCWATYGFFYWQLTVITQSLIPSLVGAINGTVTSVMEVDRQIAALGNYLRGLDANISQMFAQANAVNAQAVTYLPIPKTLDDQAAALFAQATVLDGGIILLQQQNAALLRQSAAATAQANALDAQIMQIENLRTVARLQIVSTCIPKPGAEPSHIESCQSLTGVGLP